MRQPISAMPSSIHATAQGVATIDEQHSLMRGVMYGLILVLPLWIAIGYVTFILR